MSQLYPLRFEPILRRYLWGGRRLETVLGKSLAAGNDYAESWEIVDHNRDQSVVSFGPLQGTTLSQLLKQRGAELLGRHAPAKQFPLLFKFLDANQNLSVQVHPNDQQAQRLQPPDLGKTEAWVVLHAEPNSVIYAGLKRGFDRAALERELHRGTAELCLHRIQPKSGDCIFIPAGVVHALGAGLLIAEIQQSSDTTFRLYDWNRLGPDGAPRALHVDQGLSVIDFQYGPVAPQAPQLTAFPFIERLVDCDKFVLDRWQWEGRQPIGGDQRLHILAVLSGTVRVAGDPSPFPLRAGQSALLPASMGTTKLEASDRTVMLDIYLP